MYLNDPNRANSMGPQMDDDDNSNPENESFSDLAQESMFSENPEVVREIANDFLENQNSNDRPNGDPPISGGDSSIDLSQESMFSENPEIGREIASEFLENEAQTEYDAFAPSDSETDFFERT